MNVLGVLEKNHFTSLLIGKSDSVSVQFLKYILVGGIAYAVDFGALFFLTEYCRVFYLVSAGVGFLFGLLVNYVLSISWVFPRRSLSNRRVEFLLFAVIGIVGLALNEGIIWFFTERIHCYYLLSKIISAVTVFFWNFFARKKILFS